MDKGENKVRVDEDFRALLGLHDIDPNINIVSFPDFMTPLSSADVPEITQGCMTKFQTEEDRQAYMCAFSKMLVKEKGQMKIYSCTLVDDDPKFGFIGTLKESIDRRVMLAHHRCYSCFSIGSSCSEKV